MRTPVNTRPHRQPTCAPDVAGHDGSAAYGHLGSEVRAVGGDRHARVDRRVVSEPNAVFSLQGREHRVERQRFLDLGTDAQCPVSRMGNTSNLQGGARARNQSLQL